MQVFQRNTSSTANNAYSVDRWQHKDSASTVAMTITQDTDVPTGQGFYYSLKASTTANATSNGFLGIAQRMEGYNINPLAWGTSGAKQATVSFWVKSSTAGTYALSSRNNAADRACVMEYTINSANTWEYKTVTFPADTSGTWERTTSIGNRLWWGLSAVGGNTSTIGSWQNANVYQSSNNADWSGSTATATFYLTGVQLEVGTVATPFEHRSYGEELALCQRYYYKIGPADNIPFGFCFVRSSNECRPLIHFPTQMRVAPTAVESTGTASDYRVFYNNDQTVIAQSAPAFDIASPVSFLGGLTFPGSPFSTTDTPYMRSATANAFLVLYTPICLISPPANFCIV